MTTHTELAARLREAHDLSLDGNHFDARIAVLNVAAALESTERLAGGGEPVAHMNANGVIHEAGYEWLPTEKLRPLYTTPPPQAERVPPLPKSYSGGLLLADDEGTTVRLNFTNNAEAERWFESVTYEYDRAHGITPKEGT